MSSAENPLRPMLTPRLSSAAELPSCISGLSATLSTASESSVSIAPENFNGSFVALTYPVSVTEFEVNGQPGQILVTETNSDTAVVPTLSAWGMVILIAILIPSAIWMMRRRQKTQAA